METNDCEKKECSICGLRANPEGLPHVEGQTPHPEVTDVRNRELLMFLLVIIIMIVIGIGGAVVYNRLTLNNTPEKSPISMTSVRLVDKPITGLLINKGYTGLLVFIRHES
jgi:polyferredoxin